MRFADLAKAELDAVVKKLLKEEAAEYLRAKSAAQPVTKKSAGCIWKNPDAEASDGRGAGQLVADLGLSGLQVGDAQVSPQHGNFVLNTGMATGAQVLELIEEVERRVLEETGIRLFREVRQWGGPNGESPALAPG